jgi:uncharacterized protein (TIGR03067 family)
MFTTLLLAAAVVVEADVPQKAVGHDKDQLQGTWHTVSYQGFGPNVPPDELKTLTLTFRGDTLHAHYGNKSAEGTFHLFPAKVPQAIDVTVTQGPEAVKDKTLKGIYLLEGDTLKIAYRAPGQPRPEEFVTEGHAPMYKVTLKHDKR